MARRLRTGATLSALETAYRDRLDEFVRVATAITGDAETAQDAVQEAFASAVRRRESFRGDGPLEGWLWRIVVNRARDAGQVADRRGERLGDSNGHEPDMALRAAIAMLPERQRLVIFLHYYADLDYGTIADALAIRPGTVGATLSAARVALRRMLEEVPR